MVEVVESDWQGEMPGVQEPVEREESLVATVVGPAEEGGSIWVVMVRVIVLVLAMVSE